MKSTLVAAAALLGGTQAAVHKMKLQKVPLEDQLVRFKPKPPKSSRPSIILIRISPGWLLY